MKNYFLGGLLALGVFVPFFANAISPDGWVLGSPIPQSSWISNAAGSTNSEKCTTVLNRTSCDYTGPSLALRLGYEYEFGDEFWAGDQDRRFKNHCARFQEQGNYNTGDGRNGSNPGFDRTEQLKNNSYRIRNNTSMVILKSDSIYQINAVPSTRAPGNLYIKYVVEYANDEAANTRYQHTECYPYEISRCGDGKVDTDWFKKDSSDPAEQCDEGANNGKPGSSCTADCKKVEVKDPKCSSQYNTHTEYTPTSAQWLHSSDNLCDEGSGVEFSATRNVGSAREFLWYCKNSEGKRTSSACNAKQEWCGDGVYNKDHEDCDPNDSKHTNYGTGSHKTCNFSCKLIDDEPICSSEFNGKNIYTSNSSSVIDSYVDKSKLCEVGIMFPSTFSPNQWTVGNPRIHYWGCKNGEATISDKACHLNQYRCGDGIKNGGNPSLFINNRPTEACDPADPNSNGECSSDCKEYLAATCGPKSDQAEYNSDYSAPRIKETDPGLCGTGKIKAGSLVGPDTNGKYTWKCINGTKEVACNAQDLWCGDGKVTDREKCDPKDTRSPSVKGWGTGTWIDCNPTTCQTGAISRTGPVCKSAFSGQTEYTTYSTDWLNKNSGLCEMGNIIYFNSEWSTGSQRKFTWRCSNDDLDITCTANQEWCGDGIYNKNHEDCDRNDPKHTNWGNGCSRECKQTYNPGVCGSKYNQQKYYMTGGFEHLKDTTYGLCNAGDVTGFVNHYPNPNSHTYTWQCKTKSGDYSSLCRADLEWCGDGIVQKGEGEDCDLGVNNGKPGYTCSNTCSKTVNLSCGSGDGTTRYFSTKQTNPWISNSNNEMCSQGLTVGQPSVVGTDYHMEWTCSNENGSQKTCKAYQEYCGDGKVQKTEGEECDGGIGCTSQCRLVNIPQTGCKDYFTRSLRLGETKVFIDSGHAEWHDRYIYDKDVKFSENHGDYNNGADPTFKWTDQLINNGMKIDANTSMQIIESTPYHLITPPSVRSPNNLYIEYTVWYDNVRHEYIPSRDNLYSHKECFKYEISRCGDGVIDSGYNEVCDPGSEGTAILPNGQICNSECKIETPAVPVCNSIYNGKVVDNLTETDKLCSVGTYTTGSLHFDETTNTWTWRCDNVAGVGVECSATKKVTPKGEPVIEKTLKEDIPVEYTGQKLTWIVEVTASGGDVTDFQIQDKMPEALSYSGYRVVSNEDKLTVTGPTGPVKSGSNNIYTWNVRGTLKEGHVLTIEVETEVNKMPKSEDDYLNIACVLDDGKIDCDEDEPPVKDGEPVIEKTLKEDIPVEYTGQKLTWIVEVTASGGDVTDFQIQDKMPEALSYSGYRVVSNEDKLTVTGPTGPVKSGSNNIYTWNVRGTLKEGHVLTIEVETEVNKMPKSEDDYLNIACVLDDGKIDCDEDEPPVKDGEPVIEKTLKEDIPVEYTGQKLTWIVEVTASGGDVTDFQIQDKMPEALSYSGYRVVSNEDKLTVTGPTGPVKSGSNNIYTWNVRGTLKEGHVLTIEVETEVNKMPKSEDDYLNIACVLDDGKIDCDEDEPPVKDGEPVIEKTLKEDIPVEYTGQKLTWIVEVTASGGDVTDFQIQDKMPEALSYSGYRVVSNEDKLTVTGPTGPVKSGSNNIYTWNVRGTLKEGHVLTIEVETEVNKMPKSEDDYLNIACVLDDGKIDCDEDEPPVKGGKLDVVKTLISEDKYVSHTGQALDWKVTITAKNGDVELETITDKYPSDLLSYSGYKTIGNWEDEGIKIINSEDDKKGRVVWNVSGTLQSGHKIELIVYTTVKVMPEKEVVNVACAKPVDPGQEECGTGHIHDLRIKKHILDKNNKLVKQITGNVGDTITYVIEFGNDGDEPATVILKDYLPKGVEFISGTLVVGGTKSLGTTGVENLGMMYEGKTVEIQGVNINLYESVRLAANQSGTLIIEGKILESKEENYNRTNFACIFDNDGNRIDCDDAHHNIEPNEFKCEKLTIPTGNLPNGGGSKDVTCTVSGGVADLITIDCGTGASGNRYITGVNKSELTGKCEYPSGEKTYNLKCTVEKDNKEYTSNSCNGSVKVNGTSGPTGCSGPCCNGGCGPTKHDPDTYCGKEEHKEEFICKVINPNCFNVNQGNFSIESGEYLPYYFNVYRDKRDEDFEPYSFVFRDDNDENCSSGEVNLASMKCKIVIRDPKNEEVYRKEGIDCLTKGDTRYAGNKLIGKWAAEQNERYRIDINATRGRYWPTINYVQPNVDADWKSNGYLGEYKFYIYLYEFDQCMEDNDGERRWETQTYDTFNYEGQELESAPGCQGNFVLTEPYTVQKTPSGNLTASTKTLENFKDVEGSELISFSKYLNAISTSDYHPNDTVNNAMDVFIDKYQKLAVKVDISKSKFLSSNVGVKKVPGKHIYFVDGDITVKGGNRNIETPFTIVQTRGKTTINGNVNHNMMLLTRGNIIFSGDCRSIQTVKGIFYASGSLIRTGVLHNDNLDNDVWCTQGGLNIKGVLIGNNFNNLMKDSRSHLEEWFTTSNKKGEIMKGGSVIIEYSPSIFTKSTMPPGAEDFTTALSIYKN